MAVESKRKNWFLTSIFGMKKKKGGIVKDAAAAFIIPPFYLRPSAVTRTSKLTIFVQFFISLVMVFLFTRLNLFCFSVGKKFVKIKKSSSDGSAWQINNHNLSEILVMSVSITGLFFCHLHGRQACYRLRQSSSRKFASPFDAMRRHFATNFCPFKFNSHFTFQFINFLKEQNSKKTQLFQEKAFLLYFCIFSIIDFFR